MSVSSTSSYGYLSSSNIESMISAAMVYRQEEVSMVEAKISDLEILKAVYTDLDSKMDALDTIVEDLAGLNESYTFGTAKSVSLTDTSVLTVSAGDLAVNGQYSVEVTSLAKAHSIGGKQYGQVAEALGLSGTFYIGGKANNEATAETTNANITGFSASAVQEGFTQLGSGDYYVEMRQFEGAWQFRLVNADGKAVAIAKADGSTGTTASWQNLEPVAGTTFDTGRGLSIDLAAYVEGAPADPQASFIGGASTAKVSYIAQGAAIEVTEEDSLADIKTAINAATFADGNAVQATIVDNRLVLTAATTGTAHLIAGEDSTGTVLQSLELFDGSGAVMHELQAASDAQMTINGTLTVTRSSNSNLTDVIQGLTLNLKDEGSTQITVSSDTQAAKSKITSFLSKINDVMSYLKNKTGLTETSAGGYNTNATYSRGTLAGDTLFTGLRYDLQRLLMSTYENGSLRSLGITMDEDTLNWQITDDAALTEALTNNLGEVTAFLAELGTAINTKIDPLSENEAEGILAKRISNMVDQIENQESRKSDLESNMEREKLRLREQYYNLQMQYVEALQRQQEWLLFSSSSTTTTGNLLG